MLRIKKDVDLKELEKFGFEYNTYMYVPFVGNPSYEKWFATKDKYKSFLVNICIYDYGIQMFECNDDDFSYTWNEDYITDLIQAGLVEKVSEGDNE